MYFVLALSLFGRSRLRWSYYPVLPSFSTVLTACCAVLCCVDVGFPLFCVPPMARWTNFVFCSGWRQPSVRRTNAFYCCLSVSGGFRDFLGAVAVFVSRPSVVKAAAWAGGGALRRRLACFSRSIMRGAPPAIMCWLFCFLVACRLHLFKLVVHR